MVGDKGGDVYGGHDDDGGVEGGEEVVEVFFLAEVWMDYMDYPLTEHRIDGEEHNGTILKKMRNIS